MLKDEYKVYEEKMKKSIESVMSDFATVRAGRANASVLDRIMRGLLRQPHAHPADRVYRLSRPPDAGHHPLGRQRRSRASRRPSRTSDLGINPQNDGKCIRLGFPQLTEERRKELVKQIHKYAEDGKVAVRNIRRDAHGELQEAAEGL